MSKYTVVVTDKRHDSYSIEADILSSVGAELIIANCQTEEDVIAACKQADGILLDMAPMTKKVVESLENCRVISRYGVGYDNVDVIACRKMGVIVANVPDYCEEDVSDFTLALILDCLRHITSHDRHIRNGGWNIKHTHTYRLKEKTLSVFGFGKIARSLVRKVSGFGFSQILVYDPYVDEKEISASKAKRVDQKTAIQQADFISLHMPVTDETKNMVNADFISMMKPSAFIINTARGALIDDVALINALTIKQIAGAGLDTHNQEPLPLESPYLNLDNCVLSDHAAYFTQESIIELKTKAAQNVREVLIGRMPEYLV